MKGAIIFFIMEALRFQHVSFSSSVCTSVVALQRAEMRMVRWMCGVKLKDRLPSKELRERLGIDDIALVLQQNRLRWYGHVLRKDDDWVKKCMENEVEGLRPKRTWREVVQEDCQACKMNKEDAMERCKWRKMIKDVQWSGWVRYDTRCYFNVRSKADISQLNLPHGCEWVSIYSGTGLLGLSRIKAVKRLCVCVFVQVSQDGIAVVSQQHPVPW